MCIVQNRMHRAVLLDSSDEENTNMNQTQFETGTHNKIADGLDRPQSQSSAVQHSEGSVARTIEEQTAKLPSDLFLWAAVGAIGTSAVLEFTGNSEKSRFVGQWVAPFLLLGVYNKLVKVAGSDRMH